MGISGKHVLKAFGEYEDIKVRYVVPALPVLRGVLYMGKPAYPPVEALFLLPRKRNAQPLLPRSNWTQCFPPAPIS